MALSDEDLRAVRRLRAQMDEMAPSARNDLERVLRLAGEELKEPGDGTFWLDPEETDLWVRDDMASQFRGNGDLDRWFVTGSDKNFSWKEVGRAQDRLVELVRKDSTPTSARNLLLELHGAWEAWHYNACGREVPLRLCAYHECLHRWMELLRFGFEREWEQS